MQLERLSLENESEILALLQDVWPRLYGATGCPQFSSDYLRWLYGGAEADRNLLIGCRVDGKLVGFKAYLARDLRVGNVARSAALSTHLTILPELAPEARLAVAAELSRLHPLAEGTGPEASDLLLAFFESSKTLLRNITRMAGQQKLNLAMHTFRQSILNARRAEAVAAETTWIALRRAAPSDDLSAIRDEVSCRTAAVLTWSPSAAALTHHLTQAPGATVLVTEHDRRPTGYLAGYRMDWQKKGQMTRIFIVEALAAKNPATIAVLLAEAARHAADQGYRGVVLENPPLVESAAASSVGIVETAREMVLAVRSPRTIPEQVGNFTLDVK